MNVMKFHGAVVSLAREVSGDAADSIREARRQAIREEVSRLQQQSEVLSALADAYRRCGVRRLFEDYAGTEHDLSRYCVSDGRIEGKFLSMNELVLGRILDRLDGRQWWLDDDADLLDDLRSEAAFVTGQTSIPRVVRRDDTTDPLVAGAGCKDLITLEEIAVLANVEKKTVQNYATAWKEL